MPSMEAAIQFQNLRQTGSARDYSIQFLRLKQGLSKETFLASLFFVGLKEEIQDGIRRLGPLPDTFESMAARATMVEERLLEKRKQDGSCYSCGIQGHVARVCKPHNQTGRSP